MHSRYPGAVLAISTFRSPEPVLAVLREMSDGRQMAEKSSVEYDASGPNDGCQCVKRSPIWSWLPAGHFASCPPIYDQTVPYVLPLLNEHRHEIRALFPRWRMHVPRVRLLIRDSGETPLELRVHRAA